MKSTGMKKYDQNTIMISLLQKYIENKCSEQELYILLNWLKSTGDTHLLHSICDSLWKQIDSELTYPNEKRVKVLSNEAKQLLRQIKAKEEKETKRKTFFQGYRFYRIAAVFILLFSLSIGYYFIRESRELQISYTEIVAVKGEVIKYTLEDGTHITLNSESKISIPSNYGKEKRTVEMIGEAFFDVTPNPNNPFVIKNGTAEVKVLGTSFNVKSYEFDEYMNVTVSTGKVMVNMPDQDLQLRVSASEHLSINKTTGGVTKLLVEADNYTNWIEGNLYFEKEPIQEVIQSINRKYNKTVLLECENCNYVISGTHDNKSIEAVIEAICFTTGLKFRNEGESIIIYE